MSLQEKRCIRSRGERIGSCAGSGTGGLVHRYAGSESNGGRTTRHNPSQRNAARLGFQVAEWMARRFRSAFKHLGECLSSVRVRCVSLRVTLVRLSLATLCVTGDSGRISCL